MTLDEAAVRRFLRMEAVIPAMERALADFSAGRVVQPVRTAVPVADHEGFLFVMPAYAGALGVKLVTLYPRNVGLPTHLATILLFRPETGQLLVTMDGRLITEVRTAAHGCASACGTGPPRGPRQGSAVRQGRAEGARRGPGHRRIPE